MFFGPSKIDTHFDDWEQTEIINLINILPTLTSNKFINKVYVANGHETFNHNGRKDRKSYIEFNILFESGHEFSLTFYKVYSNHPETQIDYAHSRYYYLTVPPKPLKAFEIELRYYERYYVKEKPKLLKRDVSYEAHISLNCPAQTVLDIKSGASWVSRLKKDTKFKMSQMVKIIDGNGDHLIRHPFIA
jgi:hypothetical protein